MYRFNDTVVRNRSDTFWVPSDNMSINGTPLNDLIDGYSHLTVTGRGLLNRELKTTSISGRRGVWVDDIADSERILEIKYLMEAETSIALREQFAQLNKVLRTHAPSGYLEITFADEPNYVYYAYFSGADEVEEDSLSIKSKFSLLVPDGYKKKQPQSSTGVVSLVDALEVLPEKITVTPTGAVNQVQIINAEKILSFSGAYSAGKDIVIRFDTDEIKITYNGRSILSELDRFSPLEIFTIKNGDRITAKNAIVKEVVWRDERL